MANVLERFVVSMSLDSENLIKGLTNSESAINAFNQSLNISNKKTGEAQAKASRDQVDLARKTAERFFGLSKRMLRFATLTGGAILSAFGVGKTVLDFADEKNSLLAFSSAVNATANEVFGLEKAAQAFGAKQGEMSSTLKTLADSMVNFKQFGEMGYFKDLAIAGIDIDPVINAKNSVRALYEVIDQFSDLSKDQQLRVANILGISPEMMSMMAEGEGRIRNLAKSMAETRPHSEQMLKDARDLVIEWEKLTNTAMGYVDALKAQAVPVLTELIELSNEFLTNPSKFLEELRNDVLDWFNNDRPNFVEQEDALKDVDLLAEPKESGISYSDDAMIIPKAKETKTTERVQVVSPAPQPLTLNVLLDGKIFDKRVLSINNGQIVEAKDLIQTTTDY